MYSYKNIVLVKKKVVSIHELLLVGFVRRVREFRLKRGSRLMK